MRTHDSWLDKDIRPALKVCGPSLLAREVARCARIRPRKEGVMMDSNSILKANDPGFPISRRLANFESHFSRRNTSKTRYQVN